MRKILRLEITPNQYQKAVITITFVYVLTSVSVMDCSCSKEFKLSGFSSDGREAGGLMLSVAGLNHFLETKGLLIE